MFSRAKQPRTVPLETPDNSSDSSDSENEEGKEIQVIKTKDGCSLFPLLKSPVFDCIESQHYKILKLAFLQVEFEARSPEGEDYHGVKRLLQQLFLRSRYIFYLNVVSDTAFLVLD